MLPPADGRSLGGVASQGGTPPALAAGSDGKKGGGEPDEWEGGTVTILAPPRWHGATRGLHRIGLLAQCTGGVKGAYV
jgi:hypothetical protein